MKMFAHHHPDTPHGESHPTISVSVLLTCLFIGVQGVIFVLTAATTLVGEWTIYDDNSPFAVTSMVVALLLLAFLLVDFRRNRIEAHGGQRSQYVIFGGAVALLAAFMVLLVRMIQRF